MYGESLEMREFLITVPAEVCSTESGFSSSVALSNSSESPVLKWLKGALENDDTAIEENWTLQSWELGGETLLWNVFDEVRAVLADGAVFEEFEYESLDEVTSEELLSWARRRLQSMGAKDDGPSLHIFPLVVDDTKVFIAGAFNPVQGGFLHDWLVSADAVQEVFEELSKLGYYSRDELPESAVLFEAWRAQRQLIEENHD